MQNDDVFFMRWRTTRVTLAIYARITRRQRQPHICARGSNRQRGILMRMKRSAGTTPGRCKRPPSRK